MNVYFKQPHQGLIISLVFLFNTKQLSLKEPKPAAPGPMAHRGRARTNPRPLPGSSALKHHCLGSSLPPGVSSGMSGTISLSSLILIVISETQPVGLPEHRSLSPRCTPGFSQNWDSWEPLGWVNPMLAEDTEEEKGVLVFSGCSSQFHQTMAPLHHSGSATAPGVPLWGFHWASAHSAVIDRICKTETSWMKELMCK